MPAQDGSAGGRPAADPFDESLCEKCGRCCCRKFVLAGRVYFTPFFCDHLDRASRLCRVYSRRRQVNPECIPVEVGLRRGVFPADCPYAAGREGYRPPVENLDFFGLGELAREVAREVGVSDEEFERVRREQLKARKKPDGVCTRR
jgi:uncharacterized cysteine cluster protein YcgN (CxxCxxCC family)